MVWFGLGVRYPPTNHQREASEGQSAAVEFVEVAGAALR